MTEKTLVVGCDHSAVELKNLLAAHCESLGWRVVDVGAFGSESCDYPLIAEAAAKKIASGEAALGLLVCGTGVGMSMSANKINGIRCACCSEPYSAKLSRNHNNANMLALGARVVGPELAKMIAEIWLAAEFEGGRHTRRVEQITALE